ncbi:hypothetical protein JCM10914A_36380 [Paenibacillus sp. JCM 10914]
MLSFSKINPLHFSFGSGGDSGDGDGDDDGSYDGLGGYMDVNVGDGHAHGRDDKVVVPFAEFPECYSFVDSSIFSFSS